MELSDADPQVAFRAVRQLAQTPKETIAFLGQALPAASAARPDALEALIQRLGSERFQDRDRAHKELERYDAQALAALRKAAQGNLNLEAKRRVNLLLARLVNPLAGVPLRNHRAVELVEEVGTPWAKELLDQWSRGPPDDRLTQEAKQALGRWDARVSEAPAAALLSRPAPSDEPIPSGARLRLGSTRWLAGGGEGNRCRCLVYSPDGLRLAAIGDHTLYVVDTQSGKTVFQDEITSIACALFTPDGKRLVASGHWRGINGSFPCMHVWEQKDWRKTTLDNVKGTLQEFSGKGAIAVLESPNGIQEYDLESAREVGFHPLPQGARSVLALSSKTALYGTANNSRALVCNWAAPEKARAFELPAAYATALALSPDGTMLAWGDYQNGLSLLDVTKGEVLRQLTPAASAPLDLRSLAFIRSLAFSPDGKTLAFADGTSKVHVVAWDLENNKVRWKRETKPDATAVNKISFSPDSRWIAGGADARIHVWDALTGKERADGQEVSTTATRELGFLPDGSGLWNLNAEQLCLWDFPAGTLRRTFSHTEAKSAALSSDGRRVATVSATEIRLWHSATGKMVLQLPSPNNSMTGVALSADNQRVLSWGEDFILRYWDVNNGRLLAEQLLRPEGFPTIDDDDAIPRRRHISSSLMRTSGVLTPTGSRLLWHFKKLRVYDAAAAKEVATFDEDTRLLPHGLKTSADVEWLLVAGYGANQLTTLYNLREGVRIGSVQLQHPSSGHAAFAPDGRCFAVATSRPDRKIYVFETATLKQRAVISLPHGLPTILGFSPGSRFLAAAISDGTVLIWDLWNLPQL
jgi:WD40 repeat protein